MLSSKNAIAWLDIPVIDLPRATQFYRSVLNLEVVSTQVTPPTATLMQKGAPDGITLFQSPQEQPAKIGVIPYLSCEGRLKQAVSRVKLEGGTIVQAIQSMEPFGYRAVILDSEGNRLALHAKNQTPTT